MPLRDDLVDAEPLSARPPIFGPETQFIVQTTRDLCLYGLAMPIMAAVQLRWLDHGVIPTGSDVAVAP
jgi:hypothetical protein